MLNERKLTKTELDKREDSHHEYEEKQTCSS